MTGIDYAMRLIIPTGRTPNLVQTGLQPIREDHLNALVNLPLKTLSLYGLRIDSCTASVVNREGIRWLMGRYCCRCGLRGCPVVLPGATMRGGKVQPPPRLAFRNTCTRACVGGLPLAPFFATQAHHYRPFFFFLFFWLTTVCGCHSPVPFPTISGSAGLDDLPGKGRSQQLAGAGHGVDRGTLQSHVSPLGAENGDSIGRHRRFLKSMFPYFPPPPPSLRPRFTHGRPLVSPTARHCRSNLLDFRWHGVFTFDAHAGAEVCDRIGRMLPPSLERLDLRAGRVNGPLASCWCRVDGCPSWVWGGVLSANARIIGWKVKKWAAVGAWRLCSLRWVSHDLHMPNTDPTLIFRL